MTPRLRALIPVGCLLLPACPSSGDPGGTGTTAPATDTGTAPTGGPDSTGPGVTGEPDDTTAPGTSTVTTGPGMTTPPDETTGPGVTGEPEATTAPGVTSEPDTDTNQDTGTTGEPVPAECLLPAGPVAQYFTSAVTATIDETCLVSKSVFMGDDVALEFTCPVAGVVAFTLHGGPVPEPYPTEGETFEVFHQKESSEPLTDPRMGLLLLRNGDKLRYGVATGLLFADEDLARLAAGVLPLTLSVEPGPCPHVPTFEGEPRRGDEWVCNYEALALVRLAHEGDELLQAEGGSGKLAAAGDTYTLEVRLARRGEQCQGEALDRVALALVGQNFN